MAAKTGASSMADLRAMRFVSAAEYGLDTINAILQDDLNAWNAQVNEAVGAFAETTSDRQRIWGSSAVIKMEELDEFGRPATKKQNTGSTQGFRMGRFGSAVGYTDLWLKTHTPAEMAENQLKIQRGHNEAILKQLKQAIYTNNATGEAFEDFLVDNVTLNVKSWVNAEAGTKIPDAPDGTAFADTHTHLLARAGGALAASDVNLLTGTIAEHRLGGLSLYISHTDQATVSALADFHALSAPLLEYHKDNATTVRLDTSADPSNRLIGFWGDEWVPMYTRPWAIANYIVCMADSAEKPLVRRVHSNGSLQGLRLEGKFDQYPLYADNYVDIFGFSIWNRIAGAVLYFGGLAYVNPTIV